MKTGEIMNGVARSFNRFGFKFKKHSPEILIVAGIAGAVTSAVMACKATTKVSEIIEETNKTVETIHQVQNDPEMADKYSEEDAKKDLAITYVQTGVKLAKLYGPSIVLGAVSIGCILASNNIVRKRNMALAAAYATIDSSFKDYRKRVVDRFGKELDRELKYNVKAQEIEEVVVDENGKEKTVKKTVNAVNPTDISDYARFYDDGCAGWDKDPEMNLMFLRQQQNHANELLQRKGHLFLNEVYDMLGIPRTKAGQIVGWIYDEKCPVGDNFVDFGLYDIYNEKVRDFVNGYERTVLLDFNVDGNILDMM